MPSSLSHAKTGYMVRSMRLIPRSSIKPAKESDCCGPGLKRVVTRSDDKAEKDAVKPLPWEEGRRRTTRGWRLACGAPSPVLATSDDAETARLRKTRISTNACTSV